MSVFDSNYERLQLGDKIAYLFEKAGVRVKDLQKINELVDDVVKSHSKVLVVPENKALSELIHWFRHEADTDDLAKFYSLIVSDGPVQIKGESAADSDIFEDGDRIELED
jgi:LysM repeat protein